MSTTTTTNCVRKLFGLTNIRESLAVMPRGGGKSSLSQSNAERPSIMSTLSKADISQIAEAVAEQLKPNFQALEEALQNCVLKPDFEKTKATVRTVKYDVDQLEQYTRRENIRIHNLQAEPGKLTEAVVEVLNDIFAHEDAANPPCKVCEADISVCHPVGKRDADKQTIVRFVSRQTVKSVFKYKKNLKEMEKYKEQKLFISDDLTPLRLRLKKIIRETPGTTRIHTLDGKIHCDKNGKHFVVSNPDDLFHLGIDVDLDALGLSQFV